MFEIRQRDGLARVCRMVTAHGTVDTPALLPVINPNRPLISPREMKSTFGAQAIITNSYIIWRTPGLREAALSKGVHSLADFDGTVMTDSGTFQSYMYGRVEVGAKEIVEFQRSVRTDIGTILDIFTEPAATRDDVASAIEETIKRGAEAIPGKGEMLLAGTVQGGVYADLREDCARRMSDMAFDIHPIGGVVPLMEGYRYADLVDVVIASKKGLRPSRPVHLFGAGHPMLFPLAALMGCDLFDSSSYAKYAADGRILTPAGTLRVNELAEMPCACPVCSRHSAKEMAESQRLMAEHNLHISFTELRRVREAIRGGHLWELVEERARAHPSLIEALRRLATHSEYLERFEPLSRASALFYTGPETIQRPTVKRVRARLRERALPFVNKPLVVLPEVEKPYSRHHIETIEKIWKAADARIAVAGYFGLVPIELDEVYPISQSIIPQQTDLETQADAEREIRGEASAIDPAMPVFWDWQEEMTGLREGYPAKGAPDRDVGRVRAVADYQFGAGAGGALTRGAVAIVKSKRTGRIRNAMLDGKHVLSMRAHDGFFTLKPAGATVLHAALKAPRMRVVVAEDAVPFVKAGKNLFAKFALSCDPELRPGDEALLVDSSDKLLGLGQVLLVSGEIGAFERGVAVSARDGIP
ncbi:MAG: tRNA guanosine(15) transglycosylase TgtA [Euryarchaeota archaeon]|nr:tRNA guanosine(15) transglycosylase TgtA [Euryarchaeota archaeon]